MASTSNNLKGDNFSFVKDIQLMLFGLGDCLNPLVETAQLIEIIVLEQMLTVIHQAKKVAEIRNSNNRDADRCNIGPEDILFLMRNNIGALKRIISYLAIKDESIALKKLKSKEDILEPHSKSISESKTFIKLSLEQLIEEKWKKSRKNFCLEFLEKIGIEEEDLEEAEDEIKEKRLNRANAITLNLSSTVYKEYHKSRCASFASANMSIDRFIDWIRYSGHYEDNIPVSIAEILVYLAKETIASIVDMVLILREEAKIETMVVQPIRPDEVREVIRRCWSQQSVPMTLFSRDVMPIVNKKILAI